jgi:hypothetical protein
MTESGEARPMRLLVEDEASVAITLAAILEEHGYRPP